MIPAAGRGRRIGNLPFTRILPKPLLPVVDRPIIHHIVDTMTRVGIKEIHVVVDSLDSPIIAYFQDGHDFGARISYIVQQEPTGIADAILLAEDHISNAFMVILCDSFIMSDTISDMLADMHRTGVTVIEGAVLEQDIEAIRRACCIDLDATGNITRIVEKPETPTSMYRGCGLYVFSPDIFDAIRRTPRTPPRNEREITNTIGLLAAEKKARAVVLQGHEININVIEDLIRATRLWLQKIQSATPSS
jgi:dTDP-glucose pyrophosphorylase